MKEGEKLMFFVLKQREATTLIWLFKSATQASRWCGRDIALRERERTVILLRKRRLNFLKVEYLVLNLVFSV